MEMRAGKRNIASRVSIVLAATLFALIASAAPGFGQEKESDGKYLLNNKNVKLSTFYIEISPYTYLSSVDGDVQGWIHIAGGFILNNSFYFSAFVTLSPTVGTSTYKGEEVYLSLNNGGLKLGYMHRTDRMVFWRANLAVGLGGGYSLTSETSNLGGLFESYDYKTTTYSVEPSVGLGFNLLNWWRLYVDLGYRYMGPSDDVINVNDDSFTVNVSLGFGRYRRT